MRSELLKSMLFLACLHISAYNSVGQERDIYEASKAYKAGQYEAALSGFEAASDSKTLEALGSTYYRMGKYDKAKEAYRGALEKSDNNKAGVRIRFRNHYNMGNANFMTGNYKEAIQEYEEALKYKANDPSTVHNLEVAKRKLQESQSSKSSSQNSSNESNQPGSSSSAESSTGSSQDKQEESSSVSSNLASSQKEEGSSSTDYSGSSSSEKGDGGAGSSLSSKPAEYKRAEEILDSFEDAPLVLPKIEKENYNDQYW